MAVWLKQRNAGIDRLAVDYLLGIVTRVGQTKLARSNCSFRIGFGKSYQDCPRDCIDELRDRPIFYIGRSFISGRK